MTDHHADNSELLCREVLESLPDPCVVLEPIRDSAGTITDFVYTRVNQAACDTAGIPRESFVGNRFHTISPAGTVDDLFAALCDVVATGEVMVLRDWTPQGEGRYSGRHYEVRARRIRGCVSEVWRDITDRVHAEEALAESERQFRLLAENAMDLVISLDMHAAIQWVSPSVRNILQYEPAELLGEFGVVVVNHDDRPLLLSATDEAQAGRASQCRIRLRCKDGSDRWVEAVPRPLTDDTGEVVGGVIGFRDIENEVVVQRALALEVGYDALTGLAKRPIAVDWIDEFLRLQAATDWALLCLGVNDMRAINSAYTFAAGDAVLRAVADRLVEAVGDQDRVARIAGDEFVVLMPDIGTEVEAEAAAKYLLDAVGDPFDFHGQQIEISGSIGIAQSNEHRASELLRDATAAMRQARAHGRNTWEFIHGDVGEQTRQALATQSLLRSALSDGRIHPWFMPIATMTDGEIMGYEALARWIRDDGTVVEPAEFLDAAERTGLIVNIDSTMLTQALDALLLMPPEQHVSVNISAATLSVGQLGHSVARELRRTGVHPSRLHLEVTESALLEVNDTVRTSMREVADLGVSWWVDDFGTGYSSISHLRDLPISGLKLDQSFTAAMTIEGNNATRLAHGLVGLAQGLSLTTVAEGVETLIEAQILGEQGWEMGQGWLYGRPSPTMEPCSVS